MKGQTLACSNARNSLFSKGDFATGPPGQVTRLGHAGLNSQVCLTPWPFFQKIKGGGDGGLRMLAPGYN